ADIKSLTGPFRMASSSAGLLQLDGDRVYVMPTELDFYNPELWTDDALFRTEVREALRCLQQTQLLTENRAPHCRQKD
ncbi:hypothetical protein ACC761_40435, partial [Rhizobium ruizarguesonis]